MTEPVLHIDFETRSTLDLRAVGLHRYARHPTTAIWCMSWAIGDMEPDVWVRGSPLPSAVWGHVVDGLPVYAHNAPFELEIWNNVDQQTFDWPELKPEQTYCTMAMAYAMGLPGNLEDAALAMGLSVLKDAEGRALMLRMARPRSKPGAPLVWWDEPEKLARLYAYCQQDVRVERELHKRLMPLSQTERKVWLLDYKINQRGVALDMDSVKGAVKLAEIVKEKGNAELADITAGAVQTVSAVAAFKQWLEQQNGRPFDSLAKQEVVDYLAEGNLTPASERALTLRQEIGKASTAKFDVMLNRAGEDNRLRQMYQYHGAGTGRWAGRAVQTHNLPRNMPKAEAVERIMELVRAGDHDMIDAIYGAPLSEVSRCLRSFFWAPPGKLLCSGDFANVEGRGQAWFSGEQWKLDAFVEADNKTGPGIYELAYSRMFNVPVESVKNPSEERQVGKVAELAFGYQGGAGSFHAMGKVYGVKVSDSKADEFKNAWRTAHPRIKSTWYAIEKAACSAVANPGETFECGWPGREAKFKKVGSFLWCLLPSGRTICYPYPKLLQGMYGLQLTYMTVPGQDKSGIIADPKNSSNWARISTYGGSLFNNIVQGFSRDLLADLMLRMDAAGAAIVLHTHDDCNIEVDESKAAGAAQLMQQMMRTPPAWATGFPLWADVNTMRRYGK